MPFKYVAYDRAGQRLTGTVQGRSSSEVEERLWQSDLIVTQVRRIYRLPPLYQMLPTIFGLKPYHVLTLTRQLTTLMEAGLPLVKCLDILQAQEMHPLLRKTMQSVRQDVISGVFFSEAMAKHPQVFPRIFVHMARIGEGTGTLLNMLRKVADTMEHSLATRGKLRSSLTYPAIVFVAALGSLYVLLTYTIPMMSGLFAEFKTKMPFLTAVILGASNAVRQFGPLFFMSLMTVGAIGFMYTRTKRGAMARDQLMMQAPLVGQVIRKSQVAAISDTLARVIGAGTPLITALELTRDTSDSHAIRRTLTGVIQDVTTGRSFSESLASRPEVFPPMMTETIRVAEESGSLEEQLRLVGELYTAETDRAVKQLVDLLEPAIIITVGGVVGFIAIAVLSTVYSVLPSIK